LIQSDDNFPINTHKISDKEAVFGLKSSSINLNHFLSRNLIVNGVINEIINKQIILDIINIKLPKSKVIISDNKYFFTNELISFDFSKDIDITAEKSGKNIIILYQSQPLIFIETFVCSKVTPVQNCETIRENYVNNFNKIFETILGNKFYENNINSRTTFNNDTL